MKNQARKKLIAKKRAEYASIKKHLAAKAQEIDELVKTCPHDEYSRVADPSGGHDHAYTCLTCGHEW